MRIDGARPARARGRPPPRDTPCCPCGRPRRTLPHAPSRPVTIASALPPGFLRGSGRSGDRSRGGNREGGSASTASLPNDVATRPPPARPTSFEPLECRRCPRPPPPSPPVTSPSPPVPGRCWRASTSCSPPAPASGSSGPTARASRRCCACSPACAPPRAAPCGSPRRPPPSATCPRNPTPGPARPCGRCSPGAPAWPPRSTALDEATAAPGRRRRGRHRPLHRRARSLDGARRRRPRRPRRRRRRRPRACPAARPRPRGRPGCPAARRPAPSSPRLLLARFDVFLLDEPTNDLDLDGLDRLERFVLGLDAPLMVVSHDRAFLERTVTAVAEIDDHAHTLTRYEGGWHAYLDERGPRPRARRAGLPRLHRQARRPRPTARAPSAQWANQGVRRAKRSGETDKFIRHRNMQSSEHVAAKAKITDKALARLDVVDKPWEGWDLRLSIADAGRGGDVVARLADAVVERPGVDGAARLPARPGLARGRLGRPGGGRRPQRVGQVDPARRPVRPAPARRRQPVDRARAWSSARSASGATCSPARRRCWPGSTPPPASTTAPRPARRWPSSACRPSTSSGRPTRCRPASAPAPRWRCCRSAASTSSCSTSPPTTSTSRRSSSSSRPSRRSPARSCSSPTTAPCSTPSASTGWSRWSTGSVIERR